MPEYTIEILNDNTETNELKNFLDSTGNCIIFHRPAFLSYHDISKFDELINYKFNHFIFRDKKDNIKAFIPGAIYNEKDGKRIYKTPFYSSHGGLVYEEHFQFEDFDSVINLFIKTLKDSGADTISFSQTSDCYCGEFKEKNNYLKYLLGVKGFEICNIDMLMVKKNSINFSDDFHSTINRQINQAKKNKLEFTVIKGVDRDSYDLLQKSQTRLGGKPTHSYEELERISELFPDNIYTFRTTFEDKLIAGITSIKCNNEVLNTFYIYDDEEKRDLKGMQFTYYNVFEFANRQGFKYTDLGPATFGLKPHASLISYKEKYGIFPDLRTTHTKRIE